MSTVEMGGGDMRKKTLLLTPLLFMLTGCGTTYVHQKFDIFAFDKWLDEVFSKFVLGVKFFINKINATFITGIHEFSTRQPIEQLFGGNGSTGYMNLMTNMASIVNIVSILAVLAIVINFAKNLYRNYFAQADNRYAPSAIELGKKLISAVVITVLVPYLCVTAFTTTIYGGVALGNFLASDSESNLTKLTTYKYMEEKGISFNTYCEVSQKYYGVKNLTDLNGIDMSKFDENQGFEIITKENSVNIGTPEWAGISSTDSAGIYNFWCNGAGESGDLQEGYGFKYLNVWHSFANSEKMKDILTFGVGSVLEEIIAFVAMAVLYAFGSMALARRLVDLIVLIGMSWWYIGSSISDAPNQNSIGELFKKLAGICLSQFIFSFEIMLFTEMVLSHPPYNVWLLWAWIFVLLSTPTAVEDMVIGTGTQETIGSMARTVSNLFLGDKR